MSDSEIHLHHEHHGSDQLSQWVALFTALLAAMGAILSYQGNHLMNEVLLQKNEAVLMKAHATDQWNYYQAVSTKLHLTEMAKILSPVNKQASFDASITKYKTQKMGIKIDAEKYESASSIANNEATRLDAPHNMLAFAMILFQIAVALASVTALTQRTWLMILAVVCAIGGAGLWAYGIILM